jgi:S-adenosyl methyltransferase
MVCGGGAVETTVRPVVNDQPFSPDDHQPTVLEIDTRVSRPARLYNYLAGGDGNFAVDREAAEKLAASLPEGMDTVRAAVQSLGGFTERVVRHLVAEAGVDQLLYVGMPVPTGREVHEIAQGFSASARVVYVGNDPVVLAHAHTLKRSAPEGATAYVQGSLREPAAIWAEAGRTFDLSRPVAVLIPLTLCFVPDEAEPHRVMASLLDPVPSGSHLAITHPTTDIPTAGMDEATARLAEALEEPYVVRSREDIMRFLDGLDLVPPGLVQIDSWRPPSPAPPPPPLLPLYAALARKP